MAYQGYNPYQYNSNQFYNQPMNQNYAGGGSYVQTAPVQNQNVQQPAVIPGRTVESLDVVRTIEIPMDGNTYYFPKADGTEIYTKKWLPNVTTQIDVFSWSDTANVPEPQPESHTQRQESGQDIETRVQEIVNQSVSGLSAMLTQIYNETCDRLGAIDAKIAKFEKTSSRSKSTAEDKKNS